MNSADLLYWVYLTDAVLLIVHEIDSAYWKEWELFKLPGEISFFLIVHIPLVFIILYGIDEIRRVTFVGLVISLFLGLGGLFAFGAHTYFIRKGYDQFKIPVSRGILYGLLINSLLLLWLTVQLF